VEGEPERIGLLIRVVCSC